MHINIQILFKNQKSDMYFIEAVAKSFFKSMSYHRVITVACREQNNQSELIVLEESSF